MFLFLGSGSTVLQFAHLFVLLSFPILFGYRFSEHLIPESSVSVPLRKEKVSYCSSSNTKSCKLRSRTKVK